MGPTSQPGPCVIGTKLSTVADRPEFTDGELSDDGTGTTRFPMTFRKHWGSKLGRLHKLSATTALMAARRTGVDGAPLKLAEMAKIRVRSSFYTLRRT